MIADYEDDTHFCLKCQITILGLDNYVAHRKAGTCTKSDLPKSPLPSQLLPHDDSFNLKADDFFSSLELQSSSKKPIQPASSTKSAGILTRSKTTAVIQASTSKDVQEILPAKTSGGKNVWIGGHQLKLGHGDNQTKLIKAVDQLERRKEELPTIDVFEESDVDSEEYEYEEDETSDEDNHDAPPRTHTGGKWKPSSPIQWNRTEWSQNVPSPNYTGGKWKPPPNNHTKGKWKPINEEEEAKKCKKKEVFDAPSPSYTKGKWIPHQEPSKKSPSAKITDDSPLRKSSGMVQYWCRPCNRRLSSKIVYERHIKSELHYKRTLHDKDFEDDVEEKRVIVKKKLDLTLDSRQEGESTPKKDKKRKRQTIYVKCDVCNSKVNKNSMGKHLISHYHCRKGNIYTVKAQIMVLEHIADIIAQSPFQCAVCKFYFNHHKDLVQHWLSEFHAKTQAKVEGHFWCALCQVKADDTHSMYTHLVSDEHAEVVAVINRSVPIVIKKLNLSKCAECPEQFLLNVELLQHCRSTGHQFKGNFVCAKCIQIFRSSVALKTHKKLVHGEDVFICTACDKNFRSKEEARAHRNSNEHRYKVAPPKKRACEYCQKDFSDFQRLKKHLEAEHKNYNSKCNKCGAGFTLPQELTVHLRTNACSFSKEALQANSKSCDTCKFTSNSTSEMIFHKILHTDAVVTEEQSTSKKSKVEQYQCLFCDKLFPKGSLLFHLRLHTNERPYKCEICSKGFVRKNNWALHVKNHRKVQQRRRKEDDRQFLCATCGASFKKKGILKQHMSIHLGKRFKCPHIDCIVSTRTLTELKQHEVTHSSEKKFSCDSCDYRGKTLQQLKRHLRIHTGEKNYDCGQCEFSARTISHLKRHQLQHTGSKPYMCQHCAYSCTSLENLRKHILTTSKHLGKAMYECRVDLGCTFRANFAKDFKVHLVTEHSSVFSSSKAAAKYIAGFFDKRRADAAILEEDKVVLIPDQHLQELDAMLPSVVDNLHETWNVVESYDVEESGALVPFNSDNDLFQGHF